MNKKKIIIAHKYCGFIGGIEKYIYESVLLLKQRGFLVWGIFEEEIAQNSSEFKKPFDKIIFSGEYNTIDVIDKIKQDNFINVFIHKLTKIDLFKALQKNFRTTLFVHDHDYYCMKGHKYYTFSRKNCTKAFSLCACACCDLPIHRNANGKIQYRSKNHFLKYKLFKTSRKCDSFVVLSEHMKKNLIMNKFPFKKIKKIYPVIKLKEDKKVTGNSLEFLYIGQLIRGKGVDLLLKAISHLKCDFKLNIVGKGNDETLINSLISEYGLQDKVNMVGFTLDTGKWYKSASFIVVPSRWQEPFGLIGGEAYSYFKPVIAFDVGGIEEWLKDGINGFLIKENSVEKFADKIKFFLDNPKKAENMGEAGNKLIKNSYNEKIYYEKMLELTGDN